MKKVMWFIVIMLIIAAVSYIGAYKYYTAPAEAFQGWHTNLKACLQDAVTRNVPAMIKIEAKG